MAYGSVGEFLDKGARHLAKGPVALIFAEDEVELASTVDHHRRLGFRAICLFAPETLALPADLPGVVRIGCDLHARNAVPDLLTRVAAAAAPGTWLCWGYNAEYLYFPFCESRSVGELLAFHTEERRAAMFASVIDLYAPDLGSHPDAVCRDGALFDRTGYYAETRFRDGQPLDRQIDLFGGLRRRFEEHVPWERRRIDRVTLFRAARGLTMRPDFTWSDEEMNTVSCPWHHNLTAAVASFRTAKALRRNPGSKWAVPDFRWAGSERFGWSSQQLLDLGIIEPGQWF
jgi:hypothetical protein